MAITGTFQRKQPFKDSLFKEPSGFKKWTCSHMIKSKYLIIIRIIILNLYLKLFPIFLFNFSSNTSQLFLEFLTLSAQNLTFFRISCWFRHEMHPFRSQKKSILLRNSKLFDAVTFLPRFAYDDMVFTTAALNYVIENYVNQYLWCVHITKTMIW